MNSSVEVAFVSIIDSLTNFLAASLTTVAEMVDVRLVSTDSAAMSGGSRPLSQVANSVMMPAIGMIRLSPGAQRFGVLQSVNQLTGDFRNSSSCPQAFGENRLEHYKRTPFPGLRLQRWAERPTEGAPMDSKKYIGMDVHQATISVAVREVTESW
jgi:hypothetical protein